MSFKFNPKQLVIRKMMSGPARHQLIYGGGRSGKSLLFVRSIIARAGISAGSRHLIARFRGNAVRSSIGLDTLPKVMALCFQKLRLKEHRQDGFYELPNGSQIWMGGLNEKDQVEKILGNEYATIYLNECSQIPYMSVVVARTRLAQVVEAYTENKGKFILPQRAYYDLNPVGTKHWSNLEFIRHVSPVDGKPLPYPEDYVFDRLNPKDNAANLSKETLREYESLPPRQRKRFYEGEYGTEIDGALWPFEVIDRFRINDVQLHEVEALVRKGGDVRLPAMLRVVVAIDPSGTAGPDDKRSDNVGIVVCGLGVDGRGYVLADRTCNLSPAGWARVAVTAYADFGADAIVAETNFGGDMVREVIHTADPNVIFRKVVASRGKSVRAEPVSGLYEQDKISHVGRFPDLEDEMENFSTAGYMGNKSPNRADALVWGLTQLFPSQTNTGMIDYYREESERQAVAARVPVADSFINGLPVDAGGVTVGDNIRVAMQPPANTGTVFGRNGARYMPDSEGIVYVREEDVLPLMACGFVKKLVEVAA